MFENLPILNGVATVELVVNNSSIIIELNGLDAPITAGNFVDLVNRGVYDDVPFHRIVKEPNPFVVQGGDPQGKDPNFPEDLLGTGGFIDPATGLERNIPLEIKLEGSEDPNYETLLGSSAQSVLLKNDLGTIAMARSNDPNSASSQFYFNINDNNFLDGNYSVFGEVTEGLDIINNIEQGDRIQSIEVIDGLSNFDPKVIDLYRFRNTNFSSGTYLFTRQEERDSIVANDNLNQTFELEGDGNIAFRAGTSSREEELLPFYRLRSLDIEGTYLFVGEGEYNNIFAEDSDQKDKWEKEGLDENDNDIAEYYLYGAGADRGSVFNRFQNTENGTFLFAGAAETAAINSDPNLSQIFVDQGVAFESLI